MFLATLHQRWSLTRLQRPQSPSHGHRQRTAVWFVVFWGDMLENPKRQICWCWLQTHSPILDLYEYNKEYMSSIYKTRAWPAPWQERRPAASKEGFLSDNMGFASHQQGDAKCQNGDFMVYGSNGFYAQNWSLTWEPFGSSWSDLLIVFLKCWCVMILEPQRRRLIFSGCWWRWHQIKFSKHLQSLAIVQTSFLPLCWGHSEGEEDVHLSPEEKEKQRQGLRLPRTQHAQWLDPEAATTRSRGCATSQTSDSCEPSNGGPHRIVWRDAQEHPGCFLIIWCWEISLGVYHWSLWRFDEICRVYCRVIVLADSCLILVPFFPDFAMWRWLLLVAWPQPWLCCLKGGVPHWLVRNLKSMGFSQPTPIQMQCVPAILSGNHVLASAPTGRWQLTFWNIGNVVCHAHTQRDIYIYVYYTDTDTYTYIYIYLHIIYTHIYIYIYTHVGFTLGQWAHPKFPLVSPMAWPHGFLQPAQVLEAAARPSPSWGPSWPHWANLGRTLLAVWSWTLHASWRRMACAQTMMMMMMMMTMMNMMTMMTMWVSWTHGIHGRYCQWEHVACVLQKMCQVCYAPLCPTDSALIDLLQTQKISEDTAGWCRFPAITAVLDCQTCSTLNMWYNLCVLLVCFIMIHYP